MALPARVIFELFTMVILSINSQIIHMCCTGYSHLPAILSLHSEQEECL